MSSILEQFEIASAAASEKQRQSQRHVDLGPAFHQDLTSYHGPSVAFGIVLAGGAYPLVLGAIALIVAVGIFVVMLLTGRGQLSLIELGIAPLFIMLNAGFGAVVGSVWAAIVSLVTLPIVYLFVRSLKLKGSIIWLGAICGGLVGFLAVLPMTLDLPLFATTIEPWNVALFLSLGPGLSTIVGQLGGAWGGRRAAEYAWATNWKAVLADAVGGQAKSESGENASDQDTDEPRLQFRVRHMLWIFVWFSLLLSVIRLSGIPFEFVLPLLIGWLVYQSVTLYLGSRYFKWRDARRAAGPTPTSVDQPFHVEPLAK